MAKLSVSHARVAPYICLHPQDDVVIARAQLISGQVLAWRDQSLRLRGLIPAGHKIAVRALQAGQPVRRYQQIIGYARCAIAAGEHVHSHNLDMGSQQDAYAQDSQALASTAIKPVVDSRAAPVPVAAPPSAQFMGLVRADGRVATRNYIGVLTTVNCSATVARAVAQHFAPLSGSAALSDYPQVDGVVALTHSNGCGMDYRGLGMQLLRRTLTGYALHPNFAAIMVIGLGCEANQISDWLQACGLEPSVIAGRVHHLNIQDVGGTQKAIAAGVAQVQSLLPQANAVQRRACSAGHLTVGLQCGGSDGYSGISANPALGYAVDLLVAQGGTAILSETPEIYGAEHLLTTRAQDPSVAEKLLARLRWWEHYTRINQGEMNNNPSPGNKAGGLTTILEKSLGAVAKGGSSPLTAVYEYAQPVQTKGLVFMDSPGYDPVSATGQVASGANLICFTTGRGSAYGCAPVPSLKLATNSALWQRQSEDMDINCGTIIEGSQTLAEVGQHIFAQMLRTASGAKTKSEMHGYGQNEFVPWPIGAVM